MIVFFAQNCLFRHRMCSYRARRLQRVRDAESSCCCCGTVSSRPDTYAVTLAL
jgi:hypothetical protein